MHLRLTGLIVILIGLGITNLYAGWEITQGTLRTDDEGVKTSLSTVVWKGPWKNLAEQYLPEFRIKTTISYVTQRDSDTENDARTIIYPHFKTVCLRDTLETSDEPFGEAQGIVANGIGKLCVFRMFDLQYTGIGIGKMLMNHLIAIYQFYDARHISLYVVPYAFTDKLTIADKLGVKVQTLLCHPNLPLKSTSGKMSKDVVKKIYKHLGFRDSTITDEMIRDL